MEERQRPQRLPKFYFNFKKERENLAKNQTNFTSPVTLIIGLNESLKMLQAEGLGNVFKRHETLADATTESGSGNRAGYFIRKNLLQIP